MEQRFGDGDWRYIAEQVTKEIDSAKLTALIAQLCAALNGGLA
jgi:hypothetical protein